MAKERPIGVTILAFLAILGAINAFIYSYRTDHHHKRIDIDLLPVARHQAGIRDSPVDG